MRLREREPEPSPEVERELRALERALAGEPVPAEHVAIAELARELRAERPVVDPDFAAQLDERAASGFEFDAAGVGPPSSGTERLGRLLDRLRATPPRRLIAPVGAAATLLVVVSVVISQSDEFGGGDATEPVEPLAEPTAESSEAVPPSGAPPAAADESLEAAESRARASTKRFQAGATLRAGAEAAGQPSVGPDVGRRKLAQRVDLALSTEPNELRDVADGVLGVVDRHRGFVVESSVSSGDPGSKGAERGLASFKLKLPAGQLQGALAELSDLAHVSSRTDGTVDITNRFNSAKSRIEEASEERDRLLDDLADATTINEKRRIRAQLDVVEDELQAAQGALAEAQQRVSLVPVTVTVTADGEPDDGDWGIGEALDDAGKVLTVAAGVALVSAAVLLPLALLVALLALLWRATLRQRRERALDAA